MFKTLNEKTISCFVAWNRKLLLLFPLNIGDQKQWAIHFCKLPFINLVSGKNFTTSHDSINVIIRVRFVSCFLMTSATVRRKSETTWRFAKPEVLIALVASGSLDSTRKQVQLLPMPGDTEDNLAARKTGSRHCWIVASKTPLVVMIKCYLNKMQSFSQACHNTDRYANDLTNVERAEQ